MTPSIHPRLLADEGAPHIVVAGAPTRHADSVVTDDLQPLPHPDGAGVFAYLHRTVTIAPGPACACERNAYGMTAPCIVHAAHGGGE